MQETRSRHDAKDSFEPIPILVACLTYLGFYSLMLLGFLSSLLFKPKVAKEKHRNVSTCSPYLTRYGISHPESCSFLIRKSELLLILT